MKGFVYVLSAVFVVLVVSPTRAEISCAKDIHENCPETEFFSDVPPSFSYFTDEVVSQKCSYAITSVNCTQSYLNACGNHSDQMHYKDLTSSLRDFFYEFCNETSQLRRDYRLHVSCLGQADDVAICGQTAVDALRQRHREILENERNSIVRETTEETTMDTFCRFYGLFKGCMITRTRERCGDDASTFMEVFLTKPVAKSWKDDCK